MARACPAWTSRRGSARRRSPRVRRRASGRRPGTPQQQPLSLQDDLHRPIQLLPGESAPANIPGRPGPIYPPSQAAAPTTCARPSKSLSAAAEVRADDAFGRHTSVGPIGRILGIDGIDPAPRRGLRLSEQRGRKSTSGTSGLLRRFHMSGSALTGSWGFWLLRSAHPQLARQVTLPLSHTVTNRLGRVKDHLRPIRKGSSEARQRKDQEADP
jgi:hypothetical protein